MCRYKFSVTLRVVSGSMTARCRSKCGKVYAVWRTGNGGRVIYVGRGDYGVADCKIR